ncbi:hypothetical protein E1B28_005318 [Marasmius oreades]|uniref:Oxidation resistance protein 1 n=1 Tax=Marasmius oreades TaxID=181124 RepID=A0A9P8AE58_9AGAR|nr:uncharacterized protein E1B28_005318 [Marasmius oreades]KAG7098010.1 hypothetical protein E1B28_005318 [Marasmius oreades]
MPSSIDSIPPLVPLPATSDSTTSAANKGHALDEDMVDKFATLFSPPTPRASPTGFDSIWKTPAPSSYQHPYPQPPRHERSMSSDSDFGAFVSVAASEDPLASSFADAAPDSYFSLTNTSSSEEFHAFQTAPAATTPSSTTSKTVNANGHGSNPSLSFFEEFAKVAKDANEKNRRVILDEIERESLFSTGARDDANSSEGKGTGGAVEVGDAGTTESSRVHEDSDGWGPPELTQSLIDLDHNFFSTRDRNHRRAKTVAGHPPVSIHPRPPFRSGSHSQSGSPSIPFSRSPTLSTPTVAPPIASTSTNVSSSPSPDLGTLGRSTMTDLSSSYQTLTNISSKWIGGFLSSTPDSPSSFFPSPPTLSSTSKKIKTSVFGGSHRSQSPQEPTHHPPQPHLRSETDPIYHGPSPFAPHVHLLGSISGAPGFIPERGWDKGYSNELREEFETGRRVEGSSEAVPGGLSVGVPQSGPRPSSQPTSQKTAVGIGGWIERKGGGVVELKGRKETTDPVLDVELAEKIRSNLPALSRLPRSWNLLYSLDQHGISLNTLYTNSEAAPQMKTQSSSGFATRIGALVVIKDSGDQLFGVYVGDGVKRGKGYYGSGESFLWKKESLKDQLEVYKWTGKNDYVALCDGEFLSFGGGDGAYGLYVDESLLEGSTARCPTFDNPPLCSRVGMKKGRAVMFECVGLEVWGVGP